MVNHGGTTHRFFQKWLQLSVLGFSRNAESLNLEIVVISNGATISLMPASPEKQQ